jgi:hypothetical protein
LLYAERFTGNQVRIPGYRKSLYHRRKPPRQRLAAKRLNRKSTNTRVFAGSSF